MFYPNGHSRTVPNEGQNEHDAIVNHRVIVSNLAESEQSEPGMFAITIYTNDGNGDYVHPKSGTYAIVPDITVLMDVENFSRLEITPSK